MSRSAATPSLTTHLPATQVRHNLGSVLERVHAGKERIIVERGGLPVAALVDIDVYEDLLEARDEGARRDIAISNREIAAGKTVSAVELAEELDELAQRARKAGSRA
jgi:prevent-host-death family protein